MANPSLSMISPLIPPEPFELSQNLLQLLGIQLTVVGQQNLPQAVPTVLVSNHRSALDAPVLMAGLGRNITFACHPYMANVPILKDLIAQLGSFPISDLHQFFKQGHRCLKQRQTLGIFPEGAQPMVTVQPPRFINDFHRGFAHLALRVSLAPLAVLPVALVSDDKGLESPIPLKLLGWFDPREPLFQKPGGHPIVLYRTVELRIGKPIWITNHDLEQYRGRSRSQKAQQLTAACWKTIHHLIQG